MKSFVYVLYLITVPDILDLDKKAFHRLAFENQETCLHLAHILGQEIDPSARKRQCQKIIAHHRIPLPKPDFMD